MNTDIVDNIKNYWHPDGHTSETQRDFLIEFIVLHQPKQCIEIGFAGGRHASTLIHSTNIDKLISIDIDFDYYNGRSYCAELCKLCNNLSFIEGNSTNILSEEFFAKEFPIDLDYIFIDGGHDYDTVMTDMKNCISHLKTNGVMIIDDYRSSGPVGCNIPDVDRAVETFFSERNLKYESIHLSDGKGMAIFKNP